MSLSFYVISFKCLSADHVAFSREGNMPRKPRTASGSALGTRIGRNIKDARTLLGITQGQLAEILDVENVTVSRIETGAQLPSIDRLDEVASALGVSITTLMADKDQSSAMADLLADTIRDLPGREQKFVLQFATTYAAHWKAGRKK